MILLGAIEGAGAGLAVSAAFTLVLACLLLWLGREAMTLCALSLLAGAVIGAAWSMLRRPTMDDAAIEADRQLELSELLATAWMRRGDDDPFGRAVIAMAEQRCRALSPSAVVLARFGGRAWSGIALAMALALTIGALSTSTSQSAATTPHALPALLSQAQDQTPAPRAGQRARQDRPPPDSPRMISESSDPASPARSAERGRARGDQPGDGAASGQTDVQPMDDSSRPSAARGVSHADATETGGGGAGRSAEASGEASGAGTAASAASSPSKGAADVEPLSAPSREGIQTKVSGVRDAYRDVARNYFDQQ